MARFLKALCVLFIFLVSLGGCEKADGKPTVITDFSADFTADFNDLSIDGKITVNRQGMFNLSISSPETLNGLEIGYKGNVLSLGRDGLLCTADEAYLPDTAFSSIIKKVFERLCYDEANGTLAISDNKVTVPSPVGNCEITVNSEGKIILLECAEAKLSISFTNIEII